MTDQSSEGKEPTEHLARVNGIELAYFEWGAEVRGELPSVLMVHATGFHARVWDQVIHRLGPRHVISVDQRGHGRSEKVLITDWRPMARDLSELIDRLGLEGAIGVGHSMGGHAITEAAAALPTAFERLVLIDPVIASPEDYGTDGWNLPAGTLHPTAKRKSEFASVQAMIDRFKDRAPYSLFVPEALRDYCEFGLLPAETGDGFTLACPPEIEASVYMTSRSNPDVYDSVRALDIPVMILRAKRPPLDRDVMDFTSSPTWPGLAGEFKHGKEIYLPENTHFLPMEAPDLVARYVLDYEPKA
jgi:pimeloyl-ACP methyl ester carboxylesterase